MMKQFLLQPRLSVSRDRRISTVGKTKTPRRSPGMGFPTITARLLPALLVVLLIGNSVYAAPKVEVGDYLQITVMDHPEFSRLVNVKSDGTVAYPYISDVPVVGMTTTEMQTFLIQVLQKYLDSPMVLVEKPELYQIKVQVLGQVKDPGIVEIPAGLDVQTAISSAGGPTENANPSKVHIMRPYGNGKEGYELIPSDLTTFYVTGDLNSLPKLQENDIVVVPGISNENSVLVIGSVMNPGNYVPYPGSNVLNVILMAGGFRKEADGKKVRFLRQTSPGQFEEVKLNVDKFIKKGRLEDIPLVASGDAIVVPEYAPLVSWDNLYNLVRDVYILVAVYVIYLRLRDS